MKEIKAYIKPGRLLGAIDRLEDEGARDLFVMWGRAIGAPAADGVGHFSPVPKYREQYAEIATVELICADADLERFVDALKKASADGDWEDGRIFVHDIESAAAAGVGTERRGEFASVA